jgi:hypothetical protein
MVEAPLTSASLLVRIRDGQHQEAWQQFVLILRGGRSGAPSEPAAVGARFEVVD